MVEHVCREKGKGDSLCSGTFFLLEESGLNGLTSGGLVRTPVGLESGFLRAELNSENDAALKVNSTFPKQASDLLACHQLCLYFPHSHSDPALLLDCWMETVCFIADYIWSSGH